MVAPLIPIAISTVPYLVEVATSTHRHDEKMCEIEANMRVKEMEFELKRLELEAQTAHVNAQKEIIQSLIAAAQHAFDKKIDALRHAFDQSHCLIKEHHAHLRNEETLLSEKRFDDMTDSQYFALNERLTQTSTMLIELDKLGKLLAKDFYEKVADTNIALDRSVSQISPSKYFLS